jgi:hypothetical protein
MNTTGHVTDALHVMQAQVQHTLLTVTVSSMLEQS